MKLQKLDDDNFKQAEKFFNSENEQLVKEEKIEKLEEKKERVVFMWLSVAIVLVAIILGWLYFIRRNFEKINQQVETSTAEISDTTQTFKEQFQVFEQFFETEQVASDSVEVKVTPETDLEKLSEQLKNELQNKLEE